MKIRRVLPTDWEDFRRLRLDALRTDPLAFGSTLERETGYPNERWKGWADSGALGNDSATFVVEAEPGQLVGMAGVFTDHGEYHLWGMWVAPEARGQGLGLGLLNRLLAWADSASPQRTVRLDVNPAQTAAVRLYEARGFRPTGRTTPLGHHPPAAVQEMVLAPGGALPREEGRATDSR
jgi:ribosomal protein S18 acetylase RimI-like enzyme